MSFPPKLRKDEKQDYRRRKRREGKDGHGTSNIAATVTIPANSTQGVVVQPFNLNLFSQQQQTSDGTGQYQRRNQSQHQRQYVSQNQGLRKQGEKKKSPPPGDYLPVPKKKRGPESDREKYWAVIYPYKEISNIRGNVIYGSYNELYKEVSRLWWTEWETSKEAEEALHREIRRRKEQQMDLIRKSPPHPPLLPKATPTVADLRERLDQLGGSRKITQLRPDLPATSIINPTKEVLNNQRAHQVVTDHGDHLDIEMPPRISSSDVGEINKSNVIS